MSLDQVFRKHGSLVASIWTNPHRRERYTFCNAGAGTPTVAAVAGMAMGACGADVVAKQLL